MNILKKLVIFSIGITILISCKSTSPEKIIGTIGNEKLGKDRIVICVYGTAACRPVNIDTNMTVDIEGQNLKLNQLPFGLYLEADILRDSQGKSIIKKIKIDQDKTVICFKSLKEGQTKSISDLLRNTTGVSNYKLNEKSNQVYIEYNHNTLPYNSLENTIKKAGFELE
jgi:hypothetical protein